MLSSAELLKQAQMTAKDAMTNAVHDIDERFGKNYAKKNPALVAAHMNASTLDFATSCGLLSLSAALQNLAIAIDKK